jgi:hypothetical protein
MYIVVTNICNAKYANDLLLLAKEETVLQGITEGLVQAGRRYGIEMTVEKLR